MLYIANVKTEPLMDLERGRPCILTEIPPVMPSNQRAQWLLMPKEQFYLKIVCICWRLQGDHFPALLPPIVVVVMMNFPLGHAVKLLSISWRTPSLSARTIKMS